MPCTSDGYSEPRGMAPDEQWRSLSRHHHAVESELEAYRAWSERAKERLNAIKVFIPSIEIDLPELPPKTPPWKGTTYRDKDGKWPSDIIKHCDWLSNDDY